MNWKLASQSICINMYDTKKKHNLNVFFYLILGILFFFTLFRFNFVVMNFNLCSFRYAYTLRINISNRIYDMYSMYARKKHIKIKTNDRIHTVCMTQQQSPSTTSAASKRHREKSNSARKKDYVMFIR